MYCALINMAGEIETMVVAGPEWVHTHPGYWIRLDTKARPSGRYNFTTGVFE